MCPTPRTSMPSGNTFGGSGTYYCCHCKYGPQLVELYPSCINCGHHGCSNCEMDAMGNISDREITTTAEIILCADTSSDVNSTYQHPAPAASAILCPDKMPKMGAIPAIGGPSSTENPTDGGGYDWFCCSCGDGPHCVAVAPACCECGHWRCSSCALVARK